MSIKIIKKLHNNNSGHSVVLAECYCGKQFTALKINIDQGKTTSCGCFRAEKMKNTLSENHQRYMEIKHEHNTPAYNNSLGVKLMSYNKNTSFFHYKKIKDKITYTFQSKDPFEVLDYKRTNLIHLGLPYTEEDYDNDKQSLFMYVSGLTSN